MLSSGDAERRARQALPTMTDDEGLSVRKAVDGAASASSAGAHLLGRGYGAGAGAATADAKSGSTPSCANMVVIPIWQLNVWILPRRTYQKSAVGMSSL